ncbi:MAG TPA: penicillin-binding protein [Paludibacteraceae bacterium]|nr:penicillin-binding protein [Paludibacteraceae bacterium]
MADQHKNIVFRFGIVYVFIVVAFLLVIYKIITIQFFERENWLALAAKNVKTNIEVKANRGNIFSSDGRLMASSIPTYYIYMDLRVPALQENNGQLFHENIDSLSLCLSKFFKDKSQAEYKKDITEAYNKKLGAFRIYPKKISYSQLKELKTFPLFRLGKNKSGLITKEQFRRVKPFGSLASRTIGDIYADETKGGKNGLELKFDSLLRGTPGIAIRQKVANTWQETVQVEPIDGIDVITTIDVDIQDIAEKALLDSLRSFDAQEGYVIVMEVQSGEVKAIVNMQKNENGTYSENRNGAVSDMVEPGSTFKVVSLMAALDDGKVKVTDSIDTGNGIFQFANAFMKDHNYNRGGFHKITIAEAIHASSNIGISRMIVNAYGNNPAAYVDKLYKMKVNEPMNLEIPGTAAPNIRHPLDKSKYWSKTTLPWMSIGYETQIPPIYTLAFYNSIANDGKLIRPYFVKALSKNGQILKTFQTETINEQICKPSVLQTIRETLLGVVEGRLGTAKNVRSKYVRIAGKTGTAQISKGALGYRSGGKSHQVSFCGYFPAEHPLYTCIVVIREPRIGYPSGGKMSGSVFKDIAERIMFLRSTLKPEHFVPDTMRNVPKVPYALWGSFSDLEKVTSEMRLPISGKAGSFVNVLPDEKNNGLEISKKTVYRQLMPDLKGMGAKDAVFLAEKLGLKVMISGRGKLVSQSISPGTKITKGQILSLHFQ